MASIRRSLRFAAAALLTAAPTVWGFDLTGCSSQNTGTDQPNSSSIYASLGKCHDTCVSQYAFAIVQGNNCWCSNYAPATNQATSDCNFNCPGYPFEFCGQPNAGLYGYLALNKAPIGTQGAPASPTKSSKSKKALSSKIATMQVTVAVPETSSSTAAAASTTMTTKSSITPKVWTVPYASIKTVLGTAQTVTVTPTVTPALQETPESTVVSGADPDSFWGNTGKVAGTFVVVGLLIAVCIGGAIFFYLRGFRRHDDANTLASNDDGPTANNGAPYMVDRRRSNLTLATQGMTGLTRGNSNDKSPTETKTPAQIMRRGSLPMPQDARLNPAALWNAHPNNSQISVDTFRDDRDYSRPVLHIRNPD